MAEPEKMLISPEDNDLTTEQAIKMIEYVNKVLGQQVKYKKSDKGECWSLVYAAIEAAGAALPCERGSCKGDKATYDWGRPITSIDLKTGDIIQIEGKTVWISGDGRRHTFKHHSMLVIERNGRVVTVAQQWAGKKVHIEKYDLDRATGSGKITYHRPRKGRKK